MKTVTFCRLISWMLLSLLFLPMAYGDWSNTYLDKSNPLRDADYEIDATGTLHRAYMDYATGSLIMEILRPDGTWVGEVVDDKGMTGYRPDLLFDPLGRPVILYYDLTNNASYIARKLGTYWTIDFLRSYPDPANFLAPKILFDDVDMHGFTTITSADSNKSLIHFKMPLHEAGPPVSEMIPMPDPPDGGNFGLYRVRQDEEDPEHFVFLIYHLKISGSPPPVGSPAPGPTIEEGLALGHFKNGRIDIGPITPNDDNAPGIFTVNNAFSIITLTSYADAYTKPISFVQILQESGDALVVQDLPMPTFPSESLRKLQFIWMDDEGRFHFIGGGVHHPEVPVGQQRHFVYDRQRGVVFEEGTSNPVQYSDSLGNLDDKFYFIEDGLRRYRFFKYDLSTLTTTVLSEEAFTHRDVTPRIAEDPAGQVHICKVVGNAVLYQNSNNWNKEAEVLVDEPLTPIIQDFKVINDTLHLVYTIQESEGLDYPKPVPQGICYIAHLSRPLDSSEWTLENGVLHHPDSGFTATKAFVNLDILDPANPYLVGIARFYDMVNNPPITPAELAVGYQVFRCNMNVEATEILTELEERKPYTFLTQLVPWKKADGQHRYFFPSSSGIECLTELNGNWTREVIIPTGEPASHVDGVADASGNLHLTFDSAGLKYAVIPAAGEAQLTDLASFTPGRLADTNSTEPLQLVELDSKDNPVILYNEFVRWPIAYTTKTLRFAEFLDGEWVNSTVLPGSKGMHADLVNLDGYYHIVYNDYEEGATGYVYGSPARIERQITDAALHYHEQTYKSQWFGVMQNAAFPFIQHDAHGWLYLDPSVDRQLFWSYDLNAWLYTSKYVYPYIYDFSSNQWLFYYQSIKNETWYYRTRDKTFIQ